MPIRTNFSILLLASLLFLIANVAPADEPSGLADALLFHASFDETANADFARGDKQIYTANSLKRMTTRPGLPVDVASVDRQQGRYGGCLSFTKKSDQIVFFQGAGNLPSAKQSFQGSYSFWLRLTPDQDLPPGFVDPVQITDKKWNDASFFVDFSKDVPRTFRLGVFSDYTFWNPQDRKWEDIAANERPLVTVSKPPFSRDRWTHVGITFDNFNGAPKEGLATLYLNGVSQGSLHGNQRFTWDTKRLAIMLGIYYVGQMDDLAIFDRALTAQEVKQLYQLPRGIKSLTKAVER